MNVCANCTTLWVNHKRKELEACAQKHQSDAAECYRRAEKLQSVVERLRKQNICVRDGAECEAVRMEGEVNDINDLYLKKCGEVERLRILCKRAADWMKPHVGIGEGYRIRKELLDG